MTSSSPGVRRTAAAKYSEDTLDIHGLHQDILEASEAFGEACEQLAKAKNSVRHFSDEQESRKQAISARSIESVLSLDPKASQAAIDRQVKSDQYDDDILADINRNLSAARSRLDDVESEFAMTKAHHRTLITRSDVLAQYLGYLAASKQAAAVAASQLNGI